MTTLATWTPNSEYSSVNTWSDVFDRRWVFRRKLAKTHSNGTVRNVIELLRRIINHGIRLKLCAPLDWTVQLPKVDQSSERIEVLTKDQIRSLYEVWEEYPDRLIVNQHMLIMWTGMRPIESLSLRWSDINLEDGSLLKRKTKSGKNLSLIHIWRCRRYSLCRSRWSPYH